MKSIIILLTFFQSIYSFSQTKVQNKYNYDEKCGDGNQQSINICLSNSIKKFALITDKKYNCIIKYLNTEIKSAKNNNEIKSQYMKMKGSLIASQATWKKLKEQNSDFYSGGGGTETPMLIGQSMIKDYKDRLVWLDNLIEYEGQGNETKILKCE